MIIARQIFVFSSILSGSDLFGLIGKLDSSNFYFFFQDFGESILNWFILLVIFLDYHRRVWVWEILFPNFSRVKISRSFYILIYWFCTVLLYKYNDNSLLWNTRKYTNDRQNNALLLERLVKSSFLKML